MPTDPTPKLLKYLKINNSRLDRVVKNKNIYLRVLAKALEVVEGFGEEIIKHISEGDSHAKSIILIIRHSIDAYETITSNREKRGKILKSIRDLLLDMKLYDLSRLFGKLYDWEYKMNFPKHSLWVIEDILDRALRDGNATDLPEKTESNQVDVKDVDEDDLDLFESYAQKLLHAKNIGMYTLALEEGLADEMDEDEIKRAEIDPQEFLDDEEELDDVQLKLAVQNGNLGKVIEIISNYSDGDDTAELNEQTFQEVLEMAIQYDEYEIFKYLLSKELELGFTRNTYESAFLLADELAISDKDDTETWYKYVSDLAKKAPRDVVERAGREKELM